MNIGRMNKNHLSHIIIGVAVEQTPIISTIYQYLAEVIYTAVY
jgi:hypothetical protein